MRENKPYHQRNVTVLGMTLIEKNPMRKNESIYITRNLLLFSLPETTDEHAKQEKLAKRTSTKNQ